MFEVRHYVVVLTAIETETRAALRHLRNSRPERVRDTWFLAGEFGSWTVVIAEVGPGNSRPATIGVRALEHYRPQIAAFVGIAGGVKDVALGDGIPGKDAAAQLVLARST